MVQVGRQHPPPGLRQLSRARYPRMGIPKDDGGTRPISVAALLWRAANGELLDRMETWIAIWAPREAVGGLAGDHAHGVGDLGQVNMCELLCACDFLRTCVSSAAGCWPGRRGTKPATPHVGRLENKAHSCSNATPPGAVATGALNAASKTRERGFPGLLVSDPMFSNGFLPFWKKSPRRVSSSPGSFDTTAASRNGRPPCWRPFCTVSATWRSLAALGTLRPSLTRLGTITS